MPVVGIGKKERESGISNRFENGRRGGEEEVRGCADSIRHVYIHDHNSFDTAYASLNQFCVFL